MKLALALITSACLASAAHARFGGDFTFEQLFEMSDLVVMIEHKSTERTDDRGEAKQGGKGLITTAQIRGTLKGDSSSKTIKIRHFLYDGPKSEPGDGVRFPGFDETGRIVVTSTPAKRATAFFRPPWQYIAFLKRQHDGLYVPILPQERSADCFLMVVSSEAFHGISTAERPPQAPNPAPSIAVDHENYLQMKDSNSAEVVAPNEP
jgi:hypothetical protein